MSDAAQAFADVQRVLALFTQGLSARHLQLQPLPEQSADGRRPFIHTDGAVVHLPAMIDVFSQPRHNLGAYRVAILHQLGALQYGSFEFRRDHPAAEGLVLDALAVVHTDLERFLRGGRRPALRRRVFTLLEDMRIDAAVRRDYPGARDDYTRVLAHALQSRAPVPATAGPALRVLDGLWRLSLDGAPEHAALADMDRQRLVDAVTPLRDAHATVYDSAHASEALCRWIESLLARGSTSDTLSEALIDDDTQAQAAEGRNAAGPPGEGGDDDPGNDEFEASLGGFEIDFRGQLQAEEVHRKLHGGRAAALLSQSALTPLRTPDPGASGDETTAPVPGRHRAPPAPAVATQEGPQSFLYDEWDMHGQRYLRAWCRLFETRLHGQDHDFLHEVRRRHAALSTQVRRRFAAIRPESWQRVHGTPDGDELDLDRVIEALGDRRAGHHGDDAFHIRRDRAARDVAAAFLVDMSASTDFPIPDPKARAAAVPEPVGEEGPYLWGYDGKTEIDDTPQRRVIDVAKEAMVLMGDALQTLGDQHAIYGFSGDGRHKVEFHVAKDFQDAISPRTWSALAAMEPRRSTRMGPAIRHAARKLLRQPMRLKVLLIVSDGYPQDSDYGPDRDDEEYGIQDTARALREAERAGITTFCMTIDPSGHDYLRRMCPENRYMVIEDVPSLPEALTKVYRALTV